jgi:hypothetical protein
MPNNKIRAMTKEGRNIIKATIANDAKSYVTGEFFQASGMEYMDTLNEYGYLYS